MQVDAGTGDVLDVYPTGRAPFLLVTASGHVWVQNFADGTLTHVDPSADTATTVRGGAVAGLASDGRDLWVARDGNVVAELGGTTGEEQRAFRLARRPLFEVPTPTGHAGFLGVGGGSVWLTVPGRAGGSEMLWRIDPRSGDVLTELPIGSDANPPYIHGGHLWIITKADQVLTRVDMRSIDVTQVPVDPFPWSVTAADGSLWIGQQVDPKVVRLDLNTMRTIAEVPLETNPRGLAFGNGLLWVATEDGLQVIDPATNAVIRTTEFGTFPPDTGPIGVAFLDDSVWVSIE